MEIGHFFLPDQVSNENSYMHRVRCVLRIKTMTIEFTRLSGKGQIVIPNEIRKRMKLKDGTRFLIVGIGDSLILRRIEISEEKLRLKRLLQGFRSNASKTGFDEREVRKLIESSRKASE